MPDGETTFKKTRARNLVLQDDGEVTVHTDNGFAVKLFESTKDINGNVIPGTPDPVWNNGLVQLLNLVETKLKNVLPIAFVSEPTKV